ncbi:hypothetical protein B4U37_08775 [Sutcliffiella horikoshii]|uniref:N-acetyltransferase domain-containing protein n=1 Tax=Sutcliffiella horikoshii TaxID=79883 RepID=A0ABM6KIK3_9BACI|nr:GNAT family N-acetyltransferase [Sutcliffiella horikoshii]ART76125.1 hypothetical protein B4U37_08775 [Sutcliffiella horikoshii]
MYQIKRLSECTLDQALEAWNKGFEGYFFDATMDVDRFAARLGQENISASLSIIAFDGETPIGLLLSGSKKIGNNHIAWNGGTGVAATHRKKGIGKLLVEKACEIYRAKGIHTSTLEAISKNDQAIALYDSKGYKIVDHVVHLSLETSVEFNDSLEYYPVITSAHDAQFLPIYRHDTPWQSQWWCMKDGLTLQLMGPDGETAAYAMFKRQYSPDGTLKAIVVTHCFINDEQKDPEKVLEALFFHLFPPTVASYQCTLAFFQTSNKNVYDYLIDKGFSTKVDQVWMKKPIAAGVDIG